MKCETSLMLMELTNLTIICPLRQRKNPFDNTVALLNEWKHSSGPGERPARCSEFSFTVNQYMLLLLPFSGFTGPEIKEWNWEIYSHLLSPGIHLKNLFYLFCNFGLCWSRSLSSGGMNDSGRRPSNGSVRLEAGTAECLLMLKKQEANGVTVLAEITRTIKGRLDYY